MSFRFRRSVKIAPGLRLNVGKTGMSVSAGVRGARVTIGKRGVTKTLGIPGTGISYSTRTSSSSRGMRAEERRIEKELRIASAEAELDQEQRAYEQFTKIHAFAPEATVKEEWHKLLCERDFSPAIYGLESPSLKRLVSDHRKKFIYEFKKSYWTKAYLALLLTSTVLYFIYGLALSKGSIPTIVSAVLLVAFTIRGIQNFTKGWKQARSKADTDFQNFNDEIGQLESQHPEKEKIRIHDAKALIDGQPDYVEKELESVFADIEASLADLDHPFETSISFEADKNGCVMVDLDLPEIEDVIITNSKKVLKSGKISEKNKTKKLMNEEYAHGVLGLGFYISQYIFNSSPSINEVVVSAYTQRISKKSGNIEDEYIYSVQFDKRRFEKLNLKNIDPTESVKQFPIEMNLNRSFEFKPIEPFSKKVHSDLLYKANEN
ncbi:MAG: DUF4236 domain-containing protein [Bdellovibrionaceae bacterium]|nr:DUF4236 domain-containing protein [Pseudobdellovibrionaceae bacterium]